MSGLNWKPKRRGNVYCAPACGRGCTIQEYEQAKAEAEAIASKLDGFAPRVMENLGWHASAEALDGHITVSGYRSKYVALASATHQYAGDGSWGYAYARTARAAVAKIKKQLKAHLEKLKAVQTFFDKLSSIG